jgi:hypothetical protein
MKHSAIFVVLAFVGGCTSTAPTEPGVRRTQIRDCPPGMVLICESKKQPTVNAEGEIPVYDRCNCERRMY